MRQLHPSSLAVKLAGIQAGLVVCVIVANHLTVVFTLFPEEGGYPFNCSFVHLCCPFGLLVNDLIPSFP